MILIYANMKLNEKKACFTENYTILSGGYIRMSFEDYVRNIRDLEVCRRRLMKYRSGQSSGLAAALPQAVPKEHGTELHYIEELLRKYYDLNILSPKYRGAAAVCAICRYLDTGRCVSLTGEEGACARYEKELYGQMSSEELGQLYEMQEERSAAEIFGTCSDWLIKWYKSV